MAISWDSFDKIWASTSPLTPYEFSDPNYSQGWNFVGSTPPARQMWDSIQKKNDEKFKYLRDNFGTPNIVTSSSQMTDTEKVYVYMGSEAGWNSGHWYYYDEGTSSWADGGVYNSVAFVTDTTLSIAGQPADAKATGDALALKSDLAGCTFTGNVSVNADFSVTGDATIGTDLSVAGDSTLTGNVSAGADVVAVGDVSSANIIASNNANIGGNATVTGSVASASLTTTADGTIGGNLSVSGTTALAGTSTAPTPSADDNSTKIATTEYVQTEIKPIETDVTFNDKRITNIEKLLQGNLYDYQTDSTSAYTKSVPAGAMPYAGLEKIGGKTIVMNQLEPNPTTVYTSNGSHAFNAGTKFVTGHKYYMRSGYTGTVGQKTGAAVYTRVDGANKIIVIADTQRDFSVIQTSDFDATSIGATNSIEGNCWVYVYLDGADSISNIQIVDLTLMFGAGNEPSTAEEFESMFPAETYPYNAGTLLSAGVTEVVSKDSNNATLQTIPIPTAIRNLEGYGWSAGSVYNYIDYERKVFVQNVGSRAYASGDESDSTVVTDMTTTYYPLTTAVETDISAYITDDNLINVEAGGTLTFENQNGGDYRIPVPSEEEYMIDLQSAIGG